MASRHVKIGPMIEEEECNLSSGRGSNHGLVRIDGKPFESPRGRGRGNPGWGRVGGIPFVSKRGRGRVVHLESQTEDPQTPPTDGYNAPIDNRPFESPRGRGRGNPGWGRVGGILFKSQRGRGRNINHQGRSVNTITASAPSYAIMDVDETEIFVQPAMDKLIM